MNKTILVVDDERRSVEELIRTLDELGYTTLYESDCVPAMQRYRKGGVHAVVADGSAGGNILADEIRKRDKFTPIALYSYSSSLYANLEKIQVGVFSKLDGPQPVANYIHQELQKPA